MNEDQGKGPPGEMQAPTNNNQGEGQQQEEKSDDVPMADVVATPGKVNNDQVELGKLKRIIENVLSDHSDPRFLNNWNGLLPGAQAFGLGLALDAREDVGTKFEDQLTLILKKICDDKDKIPSFVSGVCNECVREGLINANDEGFPARVASITHGLDQDYLGSFDMEQFENHIRNVLRWHEDKHQYYRSPSFAMVQSSGMGKTKLMREYAHRYNKDDSSEIECKLILCVDGASDAPSDVETHYGESLTLGENAEFTGKDANKMRSTLDKIAAKCSRKTVIFFFDEAQKLLPGESSRAYHTVLWWLRQSRDDKAYVGVFAGTLLGLSKFQVVKEPSGFSRDSKATYKNYDGKNIDKEKELLLYDPFYSLTTISLMRSHNKVDDIDDDLRDIRKYGYNGRPLFAAMLKKQDPDLAPALTLSDEDCRDGVIHNSTMYNILLRVLLSPNPTTWSINNDSIASVLGTRVQLGLANYDFVDEATSKGYAMLVTYDTPKSEGQDQMKNFGSVAIVFPPDPVCAALAMGMMQPKWTLKNGALGRPQIQGEEPRFWVDKIAKLFDQHFFLPNRGDSGEVFAALYMLLCGDVLRYNRDPYMRMFEVDLQAWLEEVEHKTPGEPEPQTRQVAEMKEVSMETEGVAPQRSTQLKDEDEAHESPDEPEPKRQRLEPRRSARLKAVPKAPECMMVDGDVEQTNKVQGCMGCLDTTDCNLSLNFIQVCRNYFRSHAWFGQSMLEYMYSTASGCYVFPQCPAIDIVFPIKHVKTNGGAISYHPCLVSVKCWDSIVKSEMQNALTDMRQYLEARRTDNDKSTKALCLLLVIGTSTTPKKLPKRVGSFPKKDTYITVVVPSSDKFGINQTIENMAGASHTSELLASHSFAFAEKNDDALRVTATEAYRELGMRLLEDKQEIWKDQIEKTAAAEN